MIVRYGSAMVCAALLVFAATTFAATPVISIAAPTSTATPTPATTPAAAATAATTPENSAPGSQPTAPAAAGPTTANPVVTNPVVASPVVTSSPFGLVSGLIFLLALVLTAGWLVKRSGGMTLRGGASMKVVAALSVGPRERVLLIEVAGQQWLLGVAQGSINTLHHFEQPLIAASNTDEFSSKLRQIWPQGFGK